MKCMLLIPAFFIIGCADKSRQHQKSKNEISIQPISPAKNTDNLKHHISQDTLSIVTETADTLKFEKEEFNQIVDEHPELYAELTYNPDYLYHNSVKSVDFSSEVGQDIYYALYAYFLKRKNGVKEFTVQRKNLIEIYSHLNSLFDYLQYGGTYFGHQRLRILGYAEYSIYLYPKNGKSFEKTYAITTQKNLYIKSLRQLIIDESSIDFQTYGKDKIERNKQLNEIVTRLDYLITDIFYLRRAQAFQYENFVYY